MAEDDRSQGGQKKSIPLHDINKQKAGRSVLKQQKCELQGDTDSVGERKRKKEREKMLKLVCLTVLKQTVC